MSTSIDEQPTTRPDQGPNPDGDGGDGSRRSWTGIASIVLAVLAVIAAFIPLIAPVGWVLAVMGLIFGIESLARRTGSHLVPIVGTAASAAALAITLIVGLVASQNPATEPPVAGRAPSSADQSDDEPSTPSDPPSEPLPPAPPRVETSPESPAAPGVTLPLGTDNAPEWQFEFGATDQDATDRYLAADSDHQGPQEGYRYVMVPVTVTNRGDVGGEPWGSIRVYFHASDDHSYDYSHMLMAHGDAYGMKPMATGSSVEIAVYLEVPEDAIAGGYWEFAAVYGDPIYVAMG